MADHGEVEYATAAGNRLRRALETYEGFLNCTLCCLIHVVAFVMAGAGGVGSLARARAFSVSCGAVAGMAVAARHRA